MSTRESRQVDLAEVRFGIDGLGTVHYSELLGSDEKYIVWLKIAPDAGVHIVYSPDPLGHWWWTVARCEGSSVPVASSTHSTSADVIDATMSFVADILAARALAPGA